MQSREHFPSGPDVPAGIRWVTFAERDLGPVTSVSRHIATGIEMSVLISWDMRPLFFFLSKMTLYDKPSLVKSIPLTDSLPAAPSAVSKTGYCRHQPVLTVAAGGQRYLCSRLDSLSPTLQADDGCFTQRRGSLARERDLEGCTTWVTSAVYLAHLRRMWREVLLLEESSTHMFLYWYTGAWHYVMLRWSVQLRWMNTSLDSGCARYTCTTCPSLGANLFFPVSVICSYKGCTVYRKLIVIATHAIHLALWLPELW